MPIYKKNNIEGVKMYRVYFTGHYGQGRFGSERAGSAERLKASAGKIGHYLTALFVIWKRNGIM